MTNSDNVSSKLGAKLLQGWAMLNENCPQCMNVPLMRSRDGQQTICVACESRPVQQPVVADTESEMQTDTDFVGNIIKYLAKQLDSLDRFVSDDHRVNQIIETIINYHQIYKLSEDLKRTILAAFEKQEKALSDTLSNRVNENSENLHLLHAISKLHLKVYNVLKD